MIEINASELSRFIQCNGSHLLGGSLPPSSDDPTARNEGTAAHWVVNEAYHRNQTPDDFLNQKAPNGVIITNAILRSVAGYFQHINRAQGAFQGVEKECGFEIPDVARVNARCDFYNFDGHQLDVDDFKHGFRIVEPKNNWGMIAYLIGICNLYDLHPSSYCVRVHQPRVAHPDGTIREWIMSPEEFENRKKYLFNRLRQPKDTITTGAHCHKCPSMMICPAFRAASYNAIDISMIAHAENIADDMIAMELAVIDDAEKRIKSRKKQLEDLAAYRIKNGSVIEGYAIETSFGNLTWNEGLQPEFLSMMTGINCVRQDSITPTQAINAGANEQVVKSLSSRVETGFKLNRISAHKRAEKLFGKKGL